MSALTHPEELSDLPSLIDQASAALANARSSAEVLQAKEMAGLAYDQAKRALRLARARKAHDDLLRVVLQVQGDAAEIEHGAVARLAEEYAAAQGRGEVAGRGGERSGREHSPAAPSAADIGISRKDIHMGRIVSEAEKAQPGIVHRTVKELVERGEEPTKAALGAVMRAAAGRPAPSPHASVSPSVAAPKKRPVPSAPPDVADMVRRFIAATDQLAAIDVAAIAAGCALRQRAELQNRCRSALDSFEALDAALEGRTHA